MALTKTKKKTKKNKRKKEEVVDEPAAAAPKAKKAKKSKKKAKKVKSETTTPVPTPEAASPAPKAKVSKAIKKLRKEMKAAKKAWHDDKKNKALKKVFKAAKAALQAEKEKSAVSSKAIKQEEPDVQPMEQEETQNGSSDPPAADDGCTTIFCGNLPWSVDEDVIKETFKGCGEVANIRWGQDRETGDFKGYAHIEFTDSAACKKAQAMNGQECGGREMRIDASKPRSGGKGGKGGAEFTGPGKVPVNEDQTPRCFIGNLSYKIDEEGLKNAFKEKGLTVVDVFFLTDKETGDFYGSSFCEFSSPEEAAKAVSFAGLPIMGRPVKVSFARPRPNGDKSAKKKRPAREPTQRPEGGTNTAFFGNLSFDIDDDKIKAWCEEQGATDLSSVRWLTDRESGEFKGCGFVQFDSVESVDKVVAMSGSDIMGRNARIDFANS